jgi:hypothetical protein
VKSEPESHYVESGRSGSGPVTTGPVSLPVQECWKRLRSQDLGRIGVVVTLLEVA